MGLLYQSSSLHVDATLLLDGLMGKTKNKDNHSQETKIRQKITKGLKVNLVKR